MANRLVEQSHLPVKKTLAQLGIPKTTFYRPLSADLASPNRLPGNGLRPLSGCWRGWVGRPPSTSRPRLEPHSGRHPGSGGGTGAGRARTVAPRAGGAFHGHEKALHLRSFRLSTARQGIAKQCPERGILKERDLITSPAFVVIKAADEFRDKTIRPNELWQTDFTYLKVTALT